MGENRKGNWWIWKVFWILLGITAIEVFMGILKVNEKLPEAFVHDTFLGLAWITHTFIILTLIKAAYIAMTCMHLGGGVRSFRWTLLLPAFILGPYLLFIIIVEATHTISL